MVIIGLLAAYVGPQYFGVVTVMLGCNKDNGARVAPLMSFQLGRRQGIVVSRRWARGSPMALRPEVWLTLLSGLFGAAACAALATSG